MNSLFMRSINWLRLSSSITRSCSTIRLKLKDEGRLIFSKSVRHVNGLVTMMQEAGIQAKAVVHNTTAGARQDNTASFENGECSVLITCEALSEGYDAPHVSSTNFTSHEFIADPDRSTASSLLGLQIVPSSTPRW
jgi:late competence protein required for DNA uptake (superfamily II DNA/RNA helicase)